MCCELAPWPNWLPMLAQRSAGAKCAPLKVICGHLRSVSTLQELLLKLVEDYYPMPADPDADANAAQKPAASKGRARRPDARPSRRVCLVVVPRICTYTAMFRWPPVPLP